MMNEIRQQIIELLAQIPDDDLPQILKEVQGIIQYNAEAAAYILGPQTQVVTKRLIIDETYIRPPFTINTDDTP